MKRELTDREITLLEEQGCTAVNWADVLVEDDFMPAYVRNVSFCGKVELGNMNGTVNVEEDFQRHALLRNCTLNNVTVGNDCFIENVHGYISNYDISDGCYISDVGVLSTQGPSSFGNGNVISVLNEGGDGNVVVYEKLTAQLAWIMIHYPAVRELALRETEKYRTRTRGFVGEGCRISGVNEISNSIIQPYCEIQGASRIADSTLMSSGDAPAFIGTDVIMENTVAAMGSTVTDGAKVGNCFVGESVHIGKGFSAESSLFFANCHMDNGEACAALCGPFSCSHHKSTLLIGGEFSFFNAGSNTNQSNHAYKMGPIHWGILERGSKTASGSHILWPAHIGVFSMVMGKLTTHPRIQNLPFSYVIATGEKTYIVPGINIRTVGTWRDVDKWPRRDRRPLSARRDIISFAFPDPYIIQFVIAGKELLESLQDRQGYDAEEYRFEGCFIKRKALVDGLRYYGLVMRLYGGEQPKDEWIDMCGMTTPKKSVEDLVSDVEDGEITTSDEIIGRLRTLHSHNELLYSSPQTTDSLAAHDEWIRMVGDDAEKEYQMGDVDDTFLQQFLDKLR